MTDHERHGERGFTLIELLVSMTLLAVILGMLGAGLRLISHGWDRNTERMEVMDMVARTLDILQRDAAGMQRVVTFVGQEPQFLFTGDAGGMSFVLLEPPFPTAAGPYFVRYAGGSNDSGAGLIRARAPYHHEMLSFPGATPANQVLVLQGSLAFRFSYGEKISEQIRWSSSWQDKTRLPHLIRLQVNDVGDTGVQFPPIVVRLRADAELTCLAQRIEHCSAKNKGNLKGGGDSRGKDEPAGRG